MSTPMAPIEEQLRVLKSGVAELHPRDGLDERLAAATAEVGRSGSSSASTRPRPT